MRFTVEIEREDDGRWLAEVKEVPGAMAYGVSAEEARARALAIARRVIAERLERVCCKLGPDEEKATAEEWMGADRLSREAEDVLAFQALP